MAELKGNLNTKITNLRLTTEQNSQQDWFKTNLAHATGLLQGQRDLGTVGRMEGEAIRSDQQPSAGKVPFKRAVTDGRPPWCG